MTDRPFSSSLGYCALTLILALYVVGLVSHGVIRHVVQTAPVWVAVWLGLRGSPWSKWVASAFFGIWLFLMVLIWLYLLGWARLITGTFTLTETAMTLIVGASAIIGIVLAVRSRTAIAWPKGLGASIGMIAVQVVALRLSFLPSISRDPW